MAEKKLNLGCGERKLSEYINVDKFGSPDMLFDLETTPWPWETSSISEVRLIHVLEHLGQQTAVFLGIMQELWRVCADGALVHIAVPHFRHDDFLNDPTHVRAITPEGMGLFSRRNCAMFAAEGAANSPLATYIGVDFDIIDMNLVPDAVWSQRLSKGECSREDIGAALLSQNNVIREIRMVLRVIKPQT